MVSRCGAIVGEEMVGTEDEGGGVDEPLALEVDQERVGAQEIRSKNSAGKCRRG